MTDRERIERLEKIVENLAYAIANSNIQVDRDGWGELHGTDSSYIENLVKELGED